MNRRQRTDFINRQLQEVINTHKVKFKGGDVWLQCPFHSERTPSLKLNLSDENVPPGAFKCFGCGEHGNWNKIAQALKLKQLDYSQQYEDEPFYSINGSDEVELGLVDPNTDDGSNTLQFSDWNRRKTWRGIKGSLLDNIGAKLKFETKIEDFKLWLPVYIMGELVGSIDCSIEKDHNGKSYINSPGRWSRYALFPYDYVKNRFSCKYVVLVEGPRDALNLLQHDVPALAVIGSYWSARKRDLILDLDPIVVVLALDPDSAGRKNQKRIQQSLHHATYLRKRSFKQGQDPADLTKPEVRRLNRQVCRFIRNKLGIEVSNRIRSRSK